MQKHCFTTPEPLSPRIKPSLLFTEALVTESSTLSETIRLLENEYPNARFSETPDYTRDNFLSVDLGTLKIGFESNGDQTAGCFGMTRSKNWPTGMKTRSGTDVISLCVPHVPRERQ